MLFLSHTFFYLSTGKLLIKLKSESASKKGKIDQYKLKSGEQVAFKRNRMLRIEVIDTGVGMTESQIASLCQDGAQFNANELQAGQGSGLGLFISKGMVMQHGGALFAASKGLGCGSTFVVTLPFYCSSDTKSNQSSEVGVSDPKPPRRLNSDTTTAGTSSSHLFSISTPSEIAPGLSITHIAASPSPPTSSQPNIEKPMPDSGEGTASVSLRILVVDDVASNRKLIARMARNKKHFVDEANHGKEAVDKAIKATEDGRPFDVILMDNEMPVMTGADAVKKIRELGCADPFIIGVTGNVLAEDVNHFLDCGANSVLPKPVKFPKLEELWIENGIFGLKA